MFSNVSKIIYFRTKDSAWVYASLDQSIPDAMMFAEKNGQKIDTIVHAVSNCFLPFDNKHILFYIDGQTKN